MEKKKACYVLCVIIFFAAILGLLRCSQSPSGQIAQITWTVVEESSDKTSQTLLVVVSNLTDRTLCYSSLPSGPEFFVMGPSGEPLDFDDAPAPGVGLLAPHGARGRRISLERKLGSVRFALYATARPSWTRRAVTPSGFREWLESKFSAGNTKLVVSEIHTLSKTFGN